MDPLNLTDRERNAPGGMSTLDGGAMSAYNPVLNTPAPAPAPAPTPTASPVEPGVAPQPTIGETLGGIKTEALRIQDILNQRQASESGAGFATSGFEAGPEYSPFDEEKARREATRNQMKLYQAEIDATNQVYDQMLNEARIQGQGRIGSQRAGAARGGLLGSDFAASQKDKVQGFNTDINRGIQAERSAAIGNIMGTVRRSVQEEIAAKREARQAGAEEYSNYLANKGARRDQYRQSIVQDMLVQGYDPSQFSEEELVEMLDGSGLKPNDIIAEYAQQKNANEAASSAADLEGRKTESEITKNLAQAEAEGFVTLGEGTMLYNPATGEQIKNPKTYKPGSASGLSVGGQTLTQDMVADVHSELNETRGSDGYADTGVYMDEFNAFVDLGGDPKDFIKEYDPNVYINPNDPTRSFLQTAMKKPASDNLFLGSLGGLDIGSAINEAASVE
jgi:hypothetical protein